MLYILFDNYVQQLTADQHGLDPLEDDGEEVVGVSDLVGFLEAVDCELGENAECQDGVLQCS